MARRLTWGANIPEELRVQMVDYFDNRTSEYELVSGDSIALGDVTRDGISDLVVRARIEEPRPGNWGVVFLVLIRDSDRFEPQVVRGPEPPIPPRGRDRSSKLDHSLTEHRSIRFGQPSRTGPSVNTRSPSHRQPTESRGFGPQVIRKAIRSAMLSGGTQVDT